MKAAVRNEAIAIIGCGCWLFTGANLIAGVLYPEFNSLAQQVLTTCVFFACGPVWVTWLTGGYD